MGSKGSKTGHSLFLIASIALFLLIWVVLALYSSFAATNLKSYKKQNEKLHSAHRIMTWIATIMWLILSINIILIFVGFFSGIGETILGLGTIAETVTTSLVAVKGVKGILDFNLGETEDDYVKKNGKKISKLLIAIVIVNLVIFVSPLVGCFIAMKDISDSKYSLDDNEDLAKAVRHIRVCIISIALLIILDASILCINIYHEESYNKKLREEYRKSKEMQIEMQPMSSFQQPMEIEMQPMSSFQQPIYQ